MGVLPDAPIHAALVQLQETLRLERRGWGWKSLTRHHFNLRLPIFDLTGVWFASNSREAGLRNREPWRCNSSHADQFSASRRLALAGIEDPGDLRSLSLPGASPGAPTGVWLTGNSRPIRPKPEQPWECKSPHADQFGMSTGPASRASVLTSACLRASGASPRHSAILSDRGSVTRSDSFT